MEKIKSVLFVIPTNTSGGAERVVCQLANHMQACGINVTLLNFDLDTSFYSVSHNVNYIKMGLEFRSKLKFLKILESPIVELRRFLYLNRLIRKLRPDIVIPFLEMAEVLTVFNCLMLGTPFCISLRNDYGAYYGYMKLLARLTYGKATLVVCQTESIRRKLLTSVSCNAVVIPNPLDVSVYNVAVNPIRNKRIINVGRLTSQKNQIMLVKAFALIANDFPDYGLDIYGDGELRQALQAEIRRLDMVGRIRLMGIEENVIRKHSNSAVFVMSSNYEGFPNTLVEAMANGIPVISTNFASKAAEELFSEGDCGWLVPVGDLNKMAETISYVLRNTEEAEMKALNSRYVIKRFRMDNILSLWISNLENALEHKYG